MRVVHLFIPMFLISFTALAAPRTDANAAWNVNINPDGSNPAAYRGEWPNHRYFPSPDDWRNVPVYQFITDRFRDGNPNNNDIKYGGYNLYDVTTRHGGDFTGVKESLPYIKSLGFDAIWISPIFQNQFNSYHGYAQVDFTLLDQRFGTLEELRAMVDEAHRLGMYVIVDIVVNHMADFYAFEGGGDDFHMHDGEYPLVLKNPENPDQQYADFKADNRFFKEGQYCDVYDDNGEKRVDPGSGSYWFSDFHHNGKLNSYGDPWQNHLGKIYGAMDDVRVTHPRVQDKIIAMTKALISSADIDGIRMDTPMQVPLYFFKRWTPAVKAHAKSLGKKNFFIFGEFYCSRERAATMVGRGRTPQMYGQPFTFIDDDYTMDSGINYRFYYDFVIKAIKYQENKLDQAKTVFQDDMRAYDFYNPEKKEVVYSMLNFINNHDQERMNWAPDGYQKTMLGSAVIAFWPGIPLYYYGDEQGFATEGSAVDGPSREDFMTSKAWYDRRSNKADLNPAVGDNFDMTHPHFRYVQTLMNVRRQYFALRTTDSIHERWMQKDATNGIYAFTRVWGDSKNWVLVAFNTWKERLSAGGSQGALYTGWSEGTRIVNALYPDEKYVLGKDGVLPELSMGGYETKVFVREDNLQPLNPVVTAIEPKHDERISGGLKEIVLHFSEEIVPESLKSNVVYDGKRLTQEHYSLDGKTLRFNVEVSPGIHRVRILDGVRAKNGKTINAAFTSRFRSGDNLNPLIQTQRNPIEDGSLASFGPVKDGERDVLFHHKAKGAEKYRVSMDNGTTWTEWKPYVENSAHRVKASGELTVQAQYWADGSAAYFARAVVK